MRRRLVLGAFIIATTFSCVDRVYFDITIPDVYTISVSGYISDQQGPYRVQVVRTFDIESKENFRTGVTAHVVMSDNEGRSEVMKQISPGVYETSLDGIRGKVGGVYKVRVELQDGRIYESVPDTLYPTGTLDSLSYEVTSAWGLNGYKYFFDIYGQAHTSEKLSTPRVMFRNRTTFKEITHPENEAGKCYRSPERGVCNYVHPCTGLQNVGTDARPSFERVGPCTCCVCWYDLFTPQIILDDKIVATNGRYPKVMFDRIPFNGWYLKYKMRVESSVMSLSPQSFRFWKAVRDQYSAVTNIFQPITGKIKGNVQQVAGEDLPAMGLFYATSMSSKDFWILREDVRDDQIPDVNPIKADVPCFDMFPNSTTTQPAFWIE